jgi:hypothetical protein
MFTIVLAAALLGQAPGQGCRIINGRMVCPAPPRRVEIRYLRLPPPLVAPPRAALPRTTLNSFEKWY